MDILPQDDTPHKRCYACTKSFPATLVFFSRNKSKKDGFADACKICDSARRKAYHDAHEEQENERRKLFRETHKEHVSEQKKRDRETHKEQIAAYKREYQQGENYKTYQKRYHQEHLDQVHEQQRQQYQEQREQRIAHQRQYLRTEKGRLVDKAHRHKRKAQKRASEGFYTAQQLQEQFQRQKGKCYYCKAKFGKIYHVDHVVPLSKGGTNEINNIVLACPTCNMRKAGRLLHEWPEGNRLL